MSWARLDDGFHRNPKQLRMSDAAFRLYVCALSYCAEAREPTGYISAEQADALRRALRKPARAIAELVTLNAWEEADGGYLIHDFHVYVEKSSTERVRKHRDMKRGGNGGGTFHGTPYSSPPKNPPITPQPVPVPEPEVSNSLPKPLSQPVENSEAEDLRPPHWREIKAAFEYRRRGET